MWPHGLEEGRTDGVRVGRLCVLEENLYSVGEPELVEWESGSPI